MQLFIFNTTSDSKTYTTAGISLTANSSLEISHSLYHRLFYCEELVTDLFAGAVYFSDGVTVFTKSDSLELIFRLSKTHNHRETVMNAHDKVTAFTWSDFGNSNQRISTMVVSSTSIGLSFTGAFSYTLTSGKYRLDTITWSET